MATATLGSLALANAEIRAAERQHELDKRARLLERRRIEFIDELISDLERLNLKSAERVPRSYEHRLAKLRDVLTEAAIPPQQLEGLRTRIAIGRLMDRLYEVQEFLFARLRPSLGIQSESWEVFPVPDNPGD